MKTVGTTLGMLTAAVMLIALLLAPSLAEAHADHHHHAQQTSAAAVPAPDAQAGHDVVADKIGVAEASAPAAYRRIQSAPGEHYAAQQMTARAEPAADQAAGPDHCMVGCCVGTSCAGSSAVATTASPLLPPQAALTLGLPDTRPMASLPTDGPRRPPRSFT